MIGRPTAAQLQETVFRPLATRFGVPGIALTAFAALLTLQLFVCITITVGWGIGMWGNNIPNAWAFGIVNFVWWIGIGHAGTFISAFLLLLEQRWRTSINRLAEAMTLFALVQAGMYPVLHLGRPWFAYWLLPYPATMDVWPQFRSALPWDFAAISTYFTLSLLFWYVGLLPDLAAARERAWSRRKRVIYGVLSLGWQGSARDWSRYRIAYGLLAGLATPLVISVHSVVSLDFAIAEVPGWHSTIFPPYFVAGALFSGFAMVLTLIIPVRSAFGLERVITAHHLDKLAKMLLVTGWIVVYSYAVEHFMSWYSGDASERHLRFHAWPFGPYAGVYWLMLACNVLVPQALWLRSVRRSPAALLVIGLLVNVGMWCERFIIVVGGLSADHLPSSWRGYAPTLVDVGLFTGTIGFFLLLLIAFLRFVPSVALAEVKELEHELHEETPALEEVRA
jgi:Ni/Fe-hydrogenase subunit HybB-like protein